MLSNTKLIVFTFFLYLLSAAVSHALVQLVDTQSSGIRVNIDDNITQGVIATGSGIPGNFELLMCSTFSDGDNAFLAPVPDGWSTLDEGECGDSGQCIVGIYGRFDDSLDSTDITCSWTDPTDAFAAGSFRYRGVDSDNPVIAAACNSGGSGELITAPSVITEPRSAVIILFSIATDNIVSPVVEPDQMLDGIFVSLGLNTQSGEFILTEGLSFTYLEGGPTGDFPLGPVPFDWRACTIALRAAPTNIPTLSEWGLGIFATFFGIAAVWALRRRSAGA